MHPRLLDLMQRCWDAVPSQRPSFSEIRVELEDILQEIQVTFVSLVVFHVTMWIDAHRNLLYIILILPGNLGEVGGRPDNQFFSRHFQQWVQHNYDTMFYSLLQ